MTARSAERHEFEVRLDRWDWFAATPLRRLARPSDREDESVEARSWSTDPRVDHHRNRTGSPVAERAPDL